MVVKWVLLNLNMPVHFSIRESDNKYRNIDSWKLAQKMIVNSKLKNLLLFLLEWVRVTDLIGNESEMTSYTNMEHPFIINTCTSIRTP